ncbi:MAG TPA: type II secretion system protein GspM [Myxococcota bacterium]|nr:type II secretion system protein GspM [Myxococcota bacterium]
MAVLGKRYEEMLAAFERLSRREKFMVGGLAVCFVLFVGVMVSVLVSSSLRGLERRIEDKTGKLTKMIDMRTQFEQAKLARKESERRIRKAMNIQLMGTLENMAQQLGIDTNEMQMNPRSSGASAETKVDEKRVEVKIPRITIDRLVDFLVQLERKAESIAVRTLNIKNNFRDPSRLDVTFIVSKFQLKEVEKEGTPAKAATKKTGS